jgi:hypothetical protein
MPHRRTARLAHWQVWLLTVSGSLLWLSGSAWLLLHYFGQARAEFGPQANPLEPWMMRLHGLVLIPALLGIGGMFVAHIPKGWTHAPQRIAGIALCALLATLIISGYLLYYVGDEAARSWASVIHWALGLGLPVVGVWHYLNGLRMRRRS